jgi:methyl-accepting chemotaxis protein
VVQGSDLARASGVKMTETRETTLRLVQLVETIARSSDEQVRLAVELSNAAAEITASTEKTAMQLTAQNLVTSDLMQSSKRLVDSVSVFRLPHA